MLSSTGLTCSLVILLLALVSKVFKHLKQEKQTAENLSESVCVSVHSLSKEWKREEGSGGPIAAATTAG